MMTVTESVKIKDFVKALNLEILLGEEEQVVELSTSNINRPGLQLTGFFDYFANNRIQVIGNAEMHYLHSCEPKLRPEKLNAFFSKQVPCLIITRGLDPMPELLEAASKYNTPVFRSNSATTPTMDQLITYLNRLLAPTVTKHAGLMDVYGVGVLLIGRSGIGKSETALELVKRGHRLIADDAVIIKEINNQLFGTSPEMIRYFMEIRGIGIIDVRSMYGVGSVRLEKGIEMVIELEAWQEGKAYDRLGDKQDTAEILGVTIPKIVIPVKPGRNLAIIIEVAARNNRLKSLGYDAAKEIINRSTGISE